MMKFLIAASTAAVFATSASFANQDVLFSYGGKDYQFKDLQPELQQRFFDTKQEARDKQLGVLDQAVMDIYIDKLAASKDNSSAETRAELLKVDPVTDADIEALYNQYKDRIGAPLEQVKGYIEQQLITMRMQEKAQQLINSAKKENGFQLKLPELESPVFTMNLTPFPAKGAKEAKVTVVEFADYRCGYCKKAKTAVDDLLKKYGDKVKVVYIDFPVVQTQTGISQKVVAGAYCARQQDKYWEYHAKAYDMQKDLGLDSAAQIASILKLNKKTFQACMNSSNSSDYVTRASEFGRTYGVTGTPTFFVNGKRIHTHDPAVDLESMVVKALK
ncbi:thioredoxin domain-containing protein [Parendozoicomonas sp. Alg238-R29]|uniref:DsbA family protein n=1 Tax=Parendozoicomonas sp. Alg238-R29 TaxID=2993446 RepID=UPI00248D6E95|nr:thioredoxin domain-containing protein [Parendozoicomonas sp. Alg238-R29]